MTKFEQDKIGREEIVNRICLLVDNLQKDQHFCLALDGEWGSGKTYFWNNKVRSKETYKITITYRKVTKWLILVMIICMFTGFLAPQITESYTHLYKLTQGTTTKNISEHLPLTLANNINYACVLILFLAILIFTDTKIRLCDLFMLVGLTYLMLSTRRQLSMLILMGAPILIRLLIDLSDRYTKKLLPELEKTFRNIAVVIALTFLVAIWSYSYGKPKMDDKFVNSKAYPVAACDFILENI